MAYINLMNGSKIPPCKNGSMVHKWEEVKKPNDNQSGWHEDKCELCGLTIGYDTSD